MTAKQPAFTAETAAQFQTFSVMNSMIVKIARPCGCEPYRDVFTYRRWQALGQQVRKGETSLRLSVVIPTTRTDKVTGEKSDGKTFRAVSVFCRCQVDAI